MIEYVTCVIDMLRLRLNAPELKCVSISYFKIPQMSIIIFTLLSVTLPTLTLINFQNIWLWPSANTLLFFLTETKSVPSKIYKLCFRLSHRLAFPVGI